MVPSFPAASHVSADSVQRSLHRTLALVRSQVQRSPFIPGQALSSDIRIGYLHGRPVERLVVTLRSPGCGWVRRGGGCTMCGHYPGTTQGVSLPPRDFVRQFKREMARYHGRPIPVLCLYNSGSILNEEEIPSEALSAILNEISRRDDIRKVVFESRPEYCTEQKVREIRERLGSRKVEVAMGLESSNDTLLSLTLNKGFTADEFRRRVQEIGRYVPFRLYVLLKGPFVTEAEAVDDAVNSIRFAQSLSPREIHLEPATLQKHTLLHELTQAGLYKLPWLWSIYEVLRRVGEKSRVYVSPFSHMPRPLHIPENCSSCTEKVRDQLIHHYNRTFDLALLHKDACGCRGRWQEEMARRDSRSMAARVMEGLEVLLRDSTLTKKEKP